MILPATHDFWHRPEHFFTLAGKAFATHFAPDRQAITGVLLLMIARAMRSQGNGGTLVVLPDKPDLHKKATSWIDPGRGEIRNVVSFQGCFDKYLPMLVGKSDAFEAAANLPGIQNYIFSRGGRDEELTDPTQIIGALTATDGAVVLSEHLRVLAFGAMLRAPFGKGNEQKVDEIDRASILDPDAVRRVRIGSLGGARRQSASRFVLNNYDTLAITASHDGPVALTMWFADSPSKTGPVARHLTDIETLLD